MCWSTILGSFWTGQRTLAKGRRKAERHVTEGLLPTAPWEAAILSRPADATKAANSCASRTFRSLRHDPAMTVLLCPEARRMSGNDASSSGPPLQVTLQDRWPILRQVLKQGHGKELSSSQEPKLPAHLLCCCRAPVLGVSCTSPT